MVEHLDEFGTIEDRIFITLVKGDGTMWAGTSAEHAKHAAT